MKMSKLIVVLLISTSGMELAKFEQHVETDIVFLGRLLISYGLIIAQL